MSQENRTSMLVATLFALTLGSMGGNAEGLIAPILYVDGNIPEAGLCGSWETACKTIQAAVNQATVPGTEIWVKQGTYILPPGSSSSTSEILVNKAVQIARWIRWG